VVIHARGAGDAVVHVLHVVTDDLAVAAGDRAATLLRRLGHLRLVMRVLDAVAGVAAAHRTGHRGQRLALATTDHVAEQAAGDGADRGTGDVVLVLRRRGVIHHLVAADLMRRRPGGTHRRHAGHLGVLRTRRLRRLLRR